MEVGLMEIVRSVNRSWIYDTSFSLYRAFHPGEKSGGKCPDTSNKTQKDRETKRGGKQKDRNQNRQTNRSQR